MSNTDFNNISFDLPKNQSNVIKVIGVGGGGSNAVNHMFLQGIYGVDFVVCNTDRQALENSSIPTKIQLGASLTEGLGAGANPKVGADAAEESIDAIKEMLESNSKMVFITVGMGGGTGTGAAPVIAKAARELDLLTIGIVTIPFSFEGKVRNEQAQKGIEKLREYVDSLVIINNNKLREVYGNLGFKAGFSKADEVLSTAARGIAEVITHHYKQNIDLKDAKTVLSNSGTAIMGSATASGKNRSEVAISSALDSPLLNDNKIIGAKNVLLLIVSGTEEITIDEIGEINDYIQAESKSNVNIIMGVGEDETLGDAISVTIVATGFNKSQQHEILNTEPKTIVHVLENEQKSTYDFSEEKTIARTVKNPSTALENKFIEENKVVFDLGEVEEDEFEIIPTTEFIENIEVIHEEIAIASPNDFVITEVVAAVEEPSEEIEEEKQQVELTFDLEISTPKEEIEETTIEVNALDIEVAEPEVITPKQEVEEVHFSLADYEELEGALAKATNQNKAATEVKEEMDFTLSTTAEIDINEQEVDYKEVSPLDLTIAELEKTSAERRKKMKNFNYKFANKVTNNIDEFEKVPAYKRMGVEFDNSLHSSEILTSRTTLENDENDDIQLRSNNSFLHDNVD